MELKLYAKYIVVKKSKMSTIDQNIIFRLRELDKSFDASTAFSPDGKQMIPFASSPPAIKRKSRQYRYVYLFSRQFYSHFSNYCLLSFRLHKMALVIV